MLFGLVCQNVFDTDIIFDQLTANKILSQILVFLQLVKVRLKSPSLIICH